MKDGWKMAADVSPLPVRTGDERKWWLLSLYLMCNRHCAEFWTDDEVSIGLNQLWANTELPFDF